MAMESWAMDYADRVDSIYILSIESILNVSNDILHRFEEDFRPSNWAIRAAEHGLRRRALN